MNTIRKQDGAVLLITLVVVTVMALVSVAVMESGAMNTLFARNTQSLMEVKERAQSLLDNAIVNTTNLPFTGGVGTTNCLNRNNCTNSTVTVAQELVTGADAQRSSVQITRLDPLLGTPPRPMSTSAGLFQVATFEAAATYDAAAEQQGRATIGQGVLTLVNKGSQ